MISTRYKRIVIPAASIISLLIILVAADIIFPLPEFKKSFSPVIYSNGELMHCFLSNDDKWRIRADKDEISEDITNAIIFKEDKYFYYHPGINLISAGRALWNNTFKGRRTSGASTITMQLARMLEPADRTWATKLKEAWRALQLEWHFTKNEILTMYLNLLPYGGNIEGVKSASLIWFGQEPKELSPAQIVVLTVIPNNPNVLMPSNRSKLMNDRNKWLLRMEREGIFAHQDVEDALNEDFDTRKFKLPRKAPHLAFRLLSEFNQKNIGNRNKAELKQYSISRDTADRIYSTIDLSMQSMVESSLSDYIRPLRNMQITNASVIVVDNRTMEVKAYAGSAGFEEEQFNGQVDGVRAIRSPGSTLKPALYMLSFDHGLVSPKSKIIDVPLDFSGYRPENYDETYRGNVTVEDALSLSLNVPAVNLLEKLGTTDLINMLTSANFKWITNNKANVGLSMVLGGCGATLEELTGLYAAFANKGLWKPLRFVLSDPIQSGKRIASSGSAYMTTEILTNLKRPDLPNEYLESAGLPRIAWKTGTSYGRRDGWAIGYNADYTIGVWTGNFDGTGVAELNGTDCAVPLLFMLFDRLDTNNDDWYFPPSDVDFRLVCTETGMVPDTFCHSRIMETFLPGISPSMRCNHLQPVFTDPKGTISYCSECLPEKGYKTSFYPNYPAELISYYEEVAIPYNKIPEHNPECTYIVEGDGPIITSLTDGAEYLVFAGRKQKLMLKSSCLNGTKLVYWYVNKKLLEKTAPEESVYLLASTGNHSITCIDDRGRSTTIHIKVTAI